MLKRGNYYNEFDPVAAAWLRELIKAGEIPAGDVDERSIEDVAPDDLAGYVQCHFFAGIGGWSIGLRLAGWPDDAPIWTGSCPCQPFSSAGKGDGFADERHLWPAFHWLIDQCRPAIVAGEQVASRNADPWIDLVRADLEALGFAFGAVAFPAASIGAPHIRDRAYWLGYAHDARLERFGSGHPAASGRLGAAGSATQASEPGWLADAGSDGREVALLDDGSSRAASGLGQAGIAGMRSVADGERPGPTNGFWRAADWLGCRDGKWRPVEPGTFPLAHGIPGRMGRLRGYGNAIVPQQAAAFIRAALGV